MNASLQALLRGMVDYAGLFPPARLPLDEAIRNYARYQTQPEAWMLGRFICPAARLHELDEYCQTLFSEEKPLPLSVLGTGGGTRLDEFLGNLYRDLQALQAFVERHQDRIAIGAMEMPLSQDAVKDERGETLQQLLYWVRHEFYEFGIRGVNPFFEVPLHSQWGDDVPQIVQRLARFNQEQLDDQTDMVAGFKLRCGGLEAAAFPTPEQVAFCLVRCLKFQVPFKATAGLHHPIHRFDPALQTRMHGFINVFGGGVLAAVHELDTDELREILRDENPSHFHFSEDGFRWGEYHVSTEEIGSLRARQLISFGSCSFDEPRDDLRALGWL